MSKRKKAVFVAVKLLFMAGLLAWLLYDARQNNFLAFQELLQQDKQWIYLIGAFAFGLSAVLLTLVRWAMLARAIGIPCTTREGIRLGMLGFLFNLSPLGVAGGDLVKTVLLEKRYKPGYAKSLASVFVDRVIGLYVLFAFATVAMLVAGFHTSSHPFVHKAFLVVLGSTIAGTVGLVAMLAPDISGGATIRWLLKIPRVGKPLHQVATSVQMYSNKLGVLLKAAAMTVFVHAFFAMAIFLIAAGLYDRHPSFAHHMALSPTANTTAIIPLAAGPYEIVMDGLYPCVPSYEDGVEVEPIGPGQGLVIALGYRFNMLLIALVGLVYYYTARAEVVEALHAVEEEGEDAVEEKGEDAIEEDEPDET